MTTSLLGRTLDMSQISSDTYCCEVSEFKQEAVIEVNMDGTRAAADTFIAAGITSVLPDSQVVSTDRPFIFLVRD